MVAERFEITGQRFSRASRSVGERRQRRTSSGMELVATARRARDPLRAASEARQRSTTLHLLVGPLSHGPSRTDVPTPRTALVDP
jgi:hypothetical protein